MNAEREIARALDDFARRLCGAMGRGKALGKLEVATDTHVSDDTVDNYCAGRTVPDIEWLLRFKDCYGDRFAELVDSVLGSLGLARNSRPARNDLDFNGDGRADVQDGVDGMIRLCEQVATALREFRDASRDGKYSQDESARLRVLTGRMVTDATRLERLVEMNTGQPAVRIA